MFCRKCEKEIVDGSKFCSFCGTKQGITQKSVKKRGNGVGTAYKDKNGKWKAEITLGYEKELDSEGNIKYLRRKATKTGFATKKEALAYLPMLYPKISELNMDIKLRDLYDEWRPQYECKVSKDTMDCYRAAYKYFSKIHFIPFRSLRTEHFQECIDDCPKGRRTKENMKALAGLLYKYAMQKDVVNKNYAEFIYVQKGEETEKAAFSSNQLRKMWEEEKNHINLKYVLVLCYTGMRLGEMLNARTDNFHPEEGYFITGSKTKAGKNRIITIAPKILPFFDGFGKGEYLFFDDGERPSEKKFRNEMFYPALQALGIDEVDNEGNHKYTPHCCRHTFATLMKNIDAPNTDKQKLIGHSSYQTTVHYTHTDIDSLKKITDNI